MASRVSPLIVMISAARPRLWVAVVGRSAAAKASCRGITIPPGRIRRRPVENAAPKLWSVYNNPPEATREDKPRATDTHPVKHRMATHEPSAHAARAPTEIKTPNYDPRPPKQEHSGLVARKPVTAAVTWSGNRAANVLDTLLSDEEKGRAFVDAFVATLPSSPLLSSPDVSSTAVVNALATAALLGAWDAPVWQRVLGSSDDPSAGLLRRLVFSPSETETLHHIAVAVQLFHPSLRFPSDIALNLSTAAAREERRGQPIADSLTFALKRQNISYSYRVRQPDTGYLLWLVLQGPLPRPHVSPLLGSPGASTSQYDSGHTPRPLLEYKGFPRYSLEVAGEWNCIPGTERPSLSYRLYAANLRRVGVGIITLSSTEREKFLGAGRAVNINISEPKKGVKAGKQTMHPFRSPVSDAKDYVREQQTAQHDAGFDTMHARTSEGASSEAPTVSREDAHTIEELIAAVAYAAANGDVPDVK